ncbi:MAG TPA: hypothetical protein DCF33_00400 [Saprospirales bacterium]|nr:hypothetical protein [Saprospirales bacterium]
MADDKSTKLLFIFFLFLLLLNYPLLTIVDKTQLWFGFPSLYLYMFVVWGLMIFGIAQIVKQRKKKP